MVWRLGVRKRDRPRCTLIVGSGSWCVHVNVVAWLGFLFLYQYVMRRKLAKTGRWICW